MAKKAGATERGLLMVGIFTLLAVGSWVTFDVYRSLSGTTVPRVLQKQIEPIKSEIDAGLMGSLRTRRQFSETELQAVRSKSAEFEATRSGVIVELVSAGQEATQTAVVEEEEEATGSGQVEEEF